MIQSQQISIDQVINQISKADCQNAKIIWEEFVKWLFFQFKTDHHVIFGHIGNYGFKIQQKTKERVPILFFNQKYLKQNKLSNINHSFILKPLLNINYNAIAANCPASIDKSIIANVMSDILHRIDSIIKSELAHRIIINLSILGKIIKFGNKIEFQYCLPSSILIKPTINRNKTNSSTLRNIIEKKSLITSQNFYKPSQILQKQYLLPKIQRKIIKQKQPQEEILVRQKSKKKNVQQKKQSQKQIIILEEKPLIRRKSASLKALSSQIKQQSLGWQMMGAGKDPLKKQHVFAKLTNQPQQLMRTTFLLQKNKVNNFNIPIIDVFSRTLACPIATQRQNPMVAARIGNNLTLSTQYFDICHEGIRTLFYKSQSLQKRIKIQENERYIMNEDQQYNIVVKQIKNQKQQQKLKQKQKNYEKYIKLFGMIDEKNINQFTQIKLSKILAKVDLVKYNNKSVMQRIIKQILREYIFAIKKSIVDYILLDPTQQDRLSVYIKFKNAPIYDAVTNNSYTAYKKQNEMVLKCKSYFEEKLSKNSEHMIKINQICIEKFKNISLISLPQSKQPYTHIDDLLDRQRIKIKQAKDFLINQWVPLLSQSYRDQINSFKRQQDKCLTFFDSAMISLFLHIRSLVQRQIQAYCSYIKQYDKKILNPPQTVVFLQKTQNIYEKCFLNIRVTHKKDDIYFMDQIEDIKSKFLLLLQNIRKFSEQIPRPQNLITKTQKLYLPIMEKDDWYFQKSKRYIQKIIQKNLENVSLSLGIYNKYKYILVQNRELEKWISNGKHDRRQYALSFQKYYQIYDEIMQKVPFFIRMNMVNVDSAELKNFLIKCTMQIIKRLQKSVYDLVMGKRNEINKQINEMLVVASTKIEDCQTLITIERQVDNFRRNGIKKLHQKNNDLIKWIGITLYSTFYVLNAEDLALLKENSQYLQAAYQKIMKYDSLILEQRKQLQMISVKESQLYISNVSQIKKLIQKLKQFGSRMLKDSALQLIKNCNQRISKQIQFVLNLNVKERLLGMDETATQKIMQLQKTIKPFDQLWNLMKKYQIFIQVCTKQSVFKANANQITSQVQQMQKSALQLSKNAIIIKLAPLSVKLIQQLIQDITQFSKNIPLITVFSNPGLKERHFEMLADIIKHDGELTKKSNLYLNKLLSMGADKKIQELLIISESASKEYFIQSTILSISNQWVNLKLDMKKIDENGVHIISQESIEQIQAVLDNHSLKIISIKGSLYAKVFENNISQLQELLQNASRFIWVASKIQDQWLHLKPVMTAPDIIKHLLIEGGKFKLIDQHWSEISKFCSQKLLLTQIVKNKSVFDKLKLCEQNFQIVARGLSSYLESKRLAFPRFFFLSNSQLLQLLSQAKVPSKMQPHLPKCFEGIYSLKFQNDQLIEGMYSHQGEYVPFKTKVNIALARGNVDAWLFQVQRQMVQSVKLQIRKCYQNYINMLRINCLFQTCAMSVLTVQKIRWTHKIQSAILQKDYKSIKTQINQQLEQTVTLLKTNQKFREIDLITLQILVFQLSYFREIAQKLQNHHVQEITNFDWIANMRYYLSGQSANQMVTQVKILLSTFDFQHQYLGNSSRLIITPLTERCYQILCSAIYFNFGGAPEGPAGTGKTETVKDLAKALGNQCIVFNCSSGLDHKSMSKFFKGLVSTGAWSCFDQFNRISIQVLSVIAQQILSVQTAKLKLNTKIVFEESQLELKRSTNCFITMNPHYDGRNNLPDNLKILFRPIVMMVPDLLTIAQVTLFSYGFAQCKLLAEKIVSFDKLCTKLLYLQQHYDSSIRSLITTLKSLQNLKRNHSTIDQNALILKALSIVYKPKLINQDIPIFEGVIRDLFGGVQQIKTNRSTLIQNVCQIWKQINFTPSDYALQKIIQTYQTVLTRHGIMLVGNPYSGKTSSLQVLAQALKRCKGEQNEYGVESIRINPKSIQLKLLYGQYDEVSKEWVEGLLPCKFKKLVKSHSNARKWLILDGPIDSIWAQNLNTVMDDNKKLCLSNGEIIKMNNQMSIIFETMDLISATPSMISRCGVIYMDSSSLSHDVLIQSWLKLNAQIDTDIITHFKQFFKLLPLIYKQMTKTMHIVSYVSMFTLTQSLLMHLSHYFNQIRNILQTENGKQSLMSEKNGFSLLSSIFGVACIWSFGATVDTNSRKTFDVILKRTIMSQITLNNKKRKVGFPEKGTLYQYKLKINIEPLTYEWIKWTDMVQQQDKIKVTNHDLIIIPTSDTHKYSYSSKISLNQNMPLLFCGPMGSGKKTLIQWFVKSQSKWQARTIYLSWRVKCSEVAKQFELELDKKGAKNKIGPKGNKIIFHIQDIHLPEKQYGSQPPIQYLRQLIDQKGVYDLKEKDKFFKQIIEVTFIFTGTPVKSSVTPRFLRHSSLLFISTIDDINANLIFSSILGFAFQNHSEHKNVHYIVKNSIELFHECFNMLKPTPLKPHYIFSLKDIQKLIKGICKADKSKIHSENLGRLWGHEVRRVFADRLLPEDKHVVEAVIQSIGRKWGKNMNETYFSDIFSNDTKKYEQVSDLQKVRLTVASALTNYNLGSQKPMDLILFNIALKHILIIIRILRQTNDHALLIGMGGIGRKSLTSLACFIVQMDQFIFESVGSYSQQNFRAKIKKVFIEIGVNSKRSSIILHDSMIKSSLFLNDINNILALGFIPQLFNLQQKIDICEKARNSLHGENLNLDQLFQQFQLKVKKSFKVIMCFSPVGSHLTTLLKMYPTFINHSTINWMFSWPTESLLSISEQFLKQTQLKSKQSFINLFQRIHMSAKNWNEVYYKQQKRIFYVTEGNFISFVKNFQYLLSQQRKNLKQLLYKYENGHRKVQQTEEMIQKMKHALETMRPQLKKLSEQTIQKLQMTRIKKEEGSLIMDQVINQQKSVSDAVDEAHTIRDECEKELAAVLPHLQAAEQALMILDKNSLTELKSMVHPPQAVKLTLQGLCLLIEPNPKQKIKNDKTLKMETDWWTASIRLLGNPKLLNDLVNFNKQAIPENIIINLGKFLNDASHKEILTVENVAKSSKACQCIIQWIYGIYSFYFVNEKVKPKKESLKVAEEKAIALNKKLQTKRQELQIVNKQIQQLNYQFEWAVKNKQKLTKQFTKCEISLQRASILITSLGSLRQRWVHKQNIFKQEEKHLDKKILMSSAEISYLGPYPKSYRQKILNQWLIEFSNHHLQLNNYTLVRTLGNQITIRKWHINSLPNDNYSVQNVLIMINSQRWPLFIDPQGQANKWIKRQYQSHKLRINKATQQNFIRNVENCIQFGTPLLIQNVGEQMDSSLMPLLLNQTYKKGATSYLKMGDNTLIYSKEFKLYLTTKLNNPTYAPEICSCTTIINFMITEQALIQQLLSLAVRKESPELQQLKQSLLFDQAQNKKDLQEIQQKILQMLTNNDNILQDQVSIEVLMNSKQKSLEIQAKQKSIEQTQVSINQMRANYYKLAQESSSLYFVMHSLQNIHSIYQYSLQYFMELYGNVFLKIKQAEDLEERIEKLTLSFRYYFYQKIGRSLLKKDKLVFSLLILFKIKKVPLELLHYILNNDQRLFSKQKTAISKPNISWMTNQIWQNIQKLRKLNEFQNLFSLFNSDEEWNCLQKVVKSPQLKSQNLPLIFTKLDQTFQFLLYNAIRPHHLIENTLTYISNILGLEFTKDLQFNFQNILDDSTATKPIFITFTYGTNPLIEIRNLAYLKGIDLQCISLGQGQGFFAQKIITTKLQKGGWILLQNCHLALAWLPRLEKLIEQLNNREKSVSQNFRLWLTSPFSQQMLPQILQKSLKISYQNSSASFKDDLKIIYNSELLSNIQLSTDENKNKKFGKIVYKLSLLHGIILERKKYGNLGWDFPYQFNQSDLRLSFIELKECYQKQSNQNNSSIEILSFLFCNCNYGGKIVYQNDENILNALFYEIFEDQNANVLKTQMSPFITLKTQNEYMDFIDTLTQGFHQQLLGLNQNARILKKLQDNHIFIKSLSIGAALPQSESNYNQKDEKQLVEMIDKILGMGWLAQPFNLSDIKKKYPIIYDQPLNVVMWQQAQRYNSLVSHIRASLMLLSGAFRGDQLLSEDLQIMQRQLLQNKIPRMWKTKSYTTFKSLSRYLMNLQQRIQFIKQWIANAALSQFWLGGLFHIPSFLAALQIKHSRIHNIPIKQLAFNFIYSKPRLLQTQQQIQVFGLYLEGADWDSYKQELKQEEVGVFIRQFPKFIITVEKNSQIKKQQIYESPVYKHAKIGNQFNKVMPQNNFITYVRLPISNSPNHWTKRGVCLSVQTNQ